METLKKYSFLKGLGKMVLSFILFAVPFFVTNFPDLANVSIGSLLVLLVNWLKIRYKLTSIEVKI